MHVRYNECFVGTGVRNLGFHPARRLARNQYRVARSLMWTSSL